MLGRRHKGASSRQILTSAGDVCLRRVYFDCRCCAQGEYAADARLGVQGGQTRQARRLLCLAGTSWSFSGSSAHLREFCGLEVAAGTIRNVCHAEAAEVERWQVNASAATVKYRKTTGEIEFLTDGTCVNTMQGWKEMRIGVFTKRKLGTAVTPDQWNGRRLKQTGARWQTDRANRMAALCALKYADQRQTYWATAA